MPKAYLGPGQTSTKEPFCENNSPKWKEPKLQWDSMKKFKKIRTSRLDTI